jgi:hypothetical protein
MAQEKVEHKNPLWKYQDARGVWHVGHTCGVFDHGGTDITYAFRDCETGEYDLVSGSRLKAAERIWKLCKHHPGK